MTACASITTGTSQNIAIESSPSAAECTAANDKGTWIVHETPENIQIKRSYSPLAVTRQKGRLKGAASVESSTKGAAYGNILFGGGIDMADGAAYDYPPSVYVKLKK